MKKVSMTQAGFSVIEVLLLGAIIGIVAFIGWHVWDSRASDTAPTKDTKQTTSSDERDVNNTDASPKAAADVPKDWVAYTNEVLGIGFAYPKEWTFTDKLKERTDVGVVRYGRTYDVGELVSVDGTNMAIGLTRKKDGRNIRTSIDEWKAYARNASINYSELTEISTSPLIFRYVQDISGAKALMYQVLGPEQNMNVLVLDQDPSRLPALDQILKTFTL